MKLYQTLLDSTTEERNAEMKRSFNKAVVLTDAKNDLQKMVAKLFVAMIAAQDCLPGEMRKHGILITGEDIREKLQDIYGLVNVFQAVVDGIIPMTEEEYDKCDSSKLALVSPFLTKDELKPMLAQAVELAKTGTAKQIRDLKPKEPTKAEKEIEGLKTQLADSQKSEKEAVEAAKGTPITFGFIATDIKPGEALVNSKQFRNRLTSDYENAASEESEANDALLYSMLQLFGKAYFKSCVSLGHDPLDFIAELAEKYATSAEGTVIETPAVEAVAA